MSYVLVLFYSRTGHVASLAEAIAEGVEAEGLEARLRTVPSLHPSYQAGDQSDPLMDTQGYLYATKEDLAGCAALALGSPSRFGAIAAPLKGFLEQTSDLWLSGTLVDRPAGVFTSASTLHGGHEGVLQSMLMPLIHHGMVVCGLPYTEPGLRTLSGGGTPYGPSHLDQDTLAPHEHALAVALGRRLAHWSTR
ncbi:MAG: NAD(P)H:quinone oxidoreductase [Gammaproteobacteria bacterium]|nr:NAD(P)H:quinone oxidoreductase [Gammaproteobacteria bacterium]